jgi:hypothetical protein
MLLNAGKGDGVELGYETNSPAPESGSQLGSTSPQEEGATLMFVVWLEI